MHPQKELQESFQAERQGSSRCGPLSRSRENRHRQKDGCEYIVALACRVLGELDAPGVRAALERMLTHSEPAVVEHARAALVRLANERSARDVASVLREHGSLQVVETVADDVPYGELTSFPRAVQATDDETVIFSWIAYESREARDEVNAKVIADPRIKDHMNKVPFDPKRMVFGGFHTIVEH